MTSPFFVNHIFSFFFFFLFLFLLLFFFFFMSFSSSSIWGYSWSYFWTFYVSTIVHCPPAPGVWGLGRIGGRPKKSKALPAGLASWHGQWEHWAWISHDSPEEIEASGHFPGHSANFTANLARFHMCDIFEYVWSHFLDLIISDI